MFYPKILESKITNPQKSFADPRHFKYGMLPPGIFLHRIYLRPVISREQSKCGHKKNEFWRMSIEEKP